MIPEFNGWKDIWQVLNVILFIWGVFVLVFVPVKLHRIESRLKTLEDSINPWNDVV